MELQLRLCQAGSDWFQYDGVPDFNFWGYTKDLLYEVEINTEGQLRERIADAANQIRNNPETLNSVYENWYQSTQMCINANGRHRTFIIKSVSILNFHQHCLRNTTGSTVW
jgi:hypothetical protein